MCCKSVASLYISIRRYFFFHSCFFFFFWLTEVKTLNFNLTFEYVCSILETNESRQHSITSTKKEKEKKNLYVCVICVLSLARDTQTETKKKIKLKKKLMRQLLLYIIQIYIPINWKYDRRNTKLQWWNERMRRRHSICLFKFAF